MSEGQSKKILIGIVVLSVILRVAAILALNRHNNPETWECNTVALNLVAGKGFVCELYGTTYHTLTAPVYPLFCAVSHRLTHTNYFVLLSAQAVLSGAICYFIYLIAAEIFGKGIGLLAAFLTATHPALIIYTTKVHELTVIVLAIVFIAWLMLRLDKHKILNNIILGSVLGLGILTRPTIIFFLPAYAIYLWARFGKLKEIIRPVIVTFLCALIMITPWTLRSRRLYKKFIFINTTSTEHFWRGNNPHASGTAFTKDREGILSTTPKEFRDKLGRLDEMGQRDLFREEALRFIKSNPRFFIRNTLKKIYYFWWFSPQAGLIYPSQWSIIYRFYYIILFSFFVFGAAASLATLSHRQRSACILLLLLCIAVSFAHSFYYVEMRHRWAIEPLMIIFSSFGIKQLSGILYANRHG